MKKLGFLFATALLLAGCGSSATPKKGEATSTNDKGQVTTVKVTTEGDKITEIDINETYELDGVATTKKDAKEKYNMKKASSIGKEWFEQMDALEKFIVKNGVAKVGELNEEGKPTNPDVLSGCTMGIKDYVKATEEAVKNAK